jgi:hypothetical protein
MFRSECLCGLLQKAGLMPVLNIFEWSAWDGFLLTHAVPGAHRISIMPGSTLSLAAASAPPAFIHVNLSQPATAFPNYFEWLASYADTNVPVINGYCASIDKWSVQKACTDAGLPHVRTARHGEPDEILIAKSRANYGGLFEGKIAANLVGEIAPPDWPYPQRVQLFRREEVPPAMWDDARLTVERYVSNPAGQFRRSYVVGHYVAAATSFSEQTLKTMDHRGGVDFISIKSAKDRPYDPRDPLSVTYKIAQAMRVDFAALDLAVDEHGVNHPIDVNTTPSWGEDRNPQLIHELGEAMELLIENGSLYADR